MKMLYLDCSMGASGDMLTAALCALLPERDEFIKEMNSLGLPGVSVRAEEKSQYGISGIHVTVEVNGEDEEQHGEHGHHHHRHSSPGSIDTAIGAMPVSERVKRDARSVYALIAEAEAKAHGQSVELVHFHEVGAMDAVADVAAVCLLMEKLELNGFFVSPVNVGSGSVRCAHGVLPVPAPATAELLRGMISYGSDIQGELCTPTGAALIKYFGKSVRFMPPICTERVGIGMGSRDFGRCNCLRAFLGESGTDSGERMLELSCNIDDMSGEALGFAMERLIEAGAADVFFTPIYMKKNRPAYMLSCICRPELGDAICKAMLRHTSTLGVRYTECCRAVLERSGEILNTSLGEVRIKRSEGFGVKKIKPE